MIYISMKYIYTHIYIKHMFYIFDIYIFSSENRHWEEILTFSSSLAEYELSRKYLRKWCLLLLQFFNPKFKQKSFMCPLSLTANVQCISESCLFYYQHFSWILWFSPYSLLRPSSKYHHTISGPMQHPPNWFPAPILDSGFTPYSS